jgi:hypothetical protein
VTSVEGKDADMSADGYYNVAYTYDNVGNGIRAITEHGDSTQKYRSEESRQYDSFGNMTTRTITDYGGNDSYTKTETFENTVDADGRLISYVIHSADNPDIPGERSTVRNFEYYPDGTVKCIHQHDTYEYWPSEEPEHYDLAIAMSDTNYSFDQSGLLNELSTINYRYDNKNTKYEDSRNGSLRDKCIYTYQWTHGTDGSVNGMIKTRQNYDYIRDEQYVANYEPDIEECVIETDENGNIIRAKNDFYDRSFVYKEFANPSAGTYARVRMREDLYFLWY